MVVTVTVVLVVVVVVVVVVVLVVMVVVVVVVVVVVGVVAALKMGIVTGGCDDNDDCDVEGHDDSGEGADRDRGSRES